jgi:adenine-specific DNA-methyltransferase
MDDVFGEVNFVTEFIWEKKKKPSFLHNNVGKLGDYIICYLKDSNYTFPFSIETTTEGKKYPLNNAGNSLTKLIFPKGSVHFDIKDCLILPQDMSEGNIITKLITPLEIKNGCNNKEFILEGEWRYSQAKLNEIIDRKEKITISKIPFRPNHIKDGNEIKKMKNFLSPVHYSMETNEDATEQINELFQKDVFDNPKPTKLIKTFIKATTYLDKDSIILDFFAGSGTTAHAVIQLNDEDAENNGNRRFILVQIDEPTNPDSEARKAGYNTVDEIARERIKRAVKKIKTKKGLSLPKDFDYGFKHYRLVTPDVQTLDKIIEFDPENERLFGIDMIDQFSHKKTETSGLQTLLTTWLIDEGYPFDTKIETKKFADYESHYIEESATLYLINLGWNTKALEALLNEIGKNKLIVHTIIVYVYSFDFESMRELKTNIKTNLDTPPEIIERY